MAFLYLSPYRSRHRPQLLHHLCELRGCQALGSVDQGLFGMGVDFDQKAISTGGHCGVHSGGYFGPA